MVLRLTIVSTDNLNCIIFILMNPSSTLKKRRSTNPSQSEAIKCSFIGTIGFIMYLTIFVNSLKEVLEMAA